MSKQRSRKSKSATSDTISPEISKDGSGPTEREARKNTLSERERLLLPPRMALVGALIGTLTGALTAIGATYLTNLHQSKLEERRWIQEDQRRFHQNRRELYARFLAVASDLFKDIEYAESLSKSDNSLSKAMARKYAANVETKSQELQEDYEQINLISSMEVREAAKGIVGKATLWSFSNSLLDLLSKTTQPEKAADPAIRDLGKDVSYQEYLQELKPAFLEAARRELNIEPPGLGE